MNKYIFLSLFFFFSLASISKEHLLFQYIDYEPFKKAFESYFNCNLDNLSLEEINQKAQNNWLRKSDWRYQVENSQEAFCQKEYYNALRIDDPYYFLEKRIKKNMTINGFIVFGATFKAMYKRVLFLEEIFKKCLQSFLFYSKNVVVYLLTGNRKLFIENGETSEIINDTLKKAIPDYHCPNEPIENETDAAYALLGLFNDQITSVVVAENNKDGVRSTTASTLEYFFSQYSDEKDTSYIGISDAPYVVYQQVISDYIIKKTKRFTAAITVAAQKNDKDAKQYNVALLRDTLARIIFVIKNMEYL